MKRSRKERGGIDRACIQADTQCIESETVIEMMKMMMTNCYLLVPFVYVFVVLRAAVDAAKGMPVKFIVAYNQFWCGG